MPEAKAFFCTNCGKKLVVDIDKLLSTIEYAIDTKQYCKAEELLLEAKMISGEDYRIYYYRAKLELEYSDADSLFKMLKKLQLLEKSQKENEVTDAINELMKCKQNGNGATMLHHATSQERFDMVVFCVEHGSDVNATYGAKTSPISVLLTPVQRGSIRDDGIPYRTKNEIKKIHQYLLENGANERRRFWK